MNKRSDDKLNISYEDRRLKRKRNLYQITSTSARDQMDGRHYIRSKRLLQKRTSSQAHQS